TVAINTTGNPGMASGGMGDVLTGVVGAVMAQCLEDQELLISALSTSPGCDTVFAAVCLSVNAHGVAGDRAAQRVAERGLLAGDLIDDLPEVLRNLEVEA
ncbi:MAG TPA: NAD(P)H-hydrate dehydratase, partial [Chthonomonadales bacterium]|nr:NAD(P)H-hydrate dehydratase [Chthonomonadales bacterium]